MTTSAVLRHGPEHVRTIEDQLVAWMGDHDYASVVRTRSSTSRPCRQQLLQALPHFLDQVKRAIRIDRVSRDGRTRSRLAGGSADRAVAARR